MPQLQVVDLGRGNTERTAIPEFFNNLAKAYKEREDTDTISRITEEYKKNRNDINAWEDLYLAVENSDISPTRRVEFLKNMNENKKQLIAKDKALNQEYKKTQKDLEKKEKEQKENAEREHAQMVLDTLNISEDEKKLFDISTVGGRTEITKKALETVSRKENPLQMEETEVDFDAGLTPKERVKRQEERYKVQTPLIMKNSDSLRELKNEWMSIQLLDDLSKSNKIGKGIQKLNINPKTGDLLIPGAGTREEQLFVKTVNDFQSKAKQSYGANVTNFELERFMSRLPTLANSKEGRELIIRQMGIINQINQLEKDELEKIFDKYGVRNIDYSQAEKLARRNIKEKEEQLRKEFFNIENVSKKHEQEIIENMKKKVKKGYVLMLNPEKQFKQIPEENVESSLDKGYTKL